MSDTIAAVLDGLRIRERNLELEACAIRARIAEVRDLIDSLEQPQRRRRPRKVELVEPIGEQPEPESAA